MITHTEQSIGNGIFSLKSFLSIEVVARAWDRLYHTSYQTSPSTGLLERAVHQLMADVVYSLAHTPLFRYGAKDLPNSTSLVTEETITMRKQ